MLGHTVEILETRWLEYGSWGRLPCFPLMPPTPHAWHSGGLLDGTVAHMANHSSGAEVFSKGPGSNLKRDCLHRGQRSSGQERPISCWPLRDRHINSWVVTPRPPQPHLLRTSPSTLSMYSTQGSHGLLMGQRPWPWELHKQTRREFDMRRKWLTSLLFTTLFLLFDFFRHLEGVWVNTAHIKLDLWIFKYKLEVKLLLMGDWVPKI